MIGLRLRLPQGMRQILDARLNGHRPAWAVHVCDDRVIAKLAERLGFPTVLAQPINLPTWDWAALRGLDVLLIYRPEGGDPVVAADNIQAARPADLTVVAIWDWSDSVARFFGGHD